MGAWKYQTENSEETAPGWNIGNNCLTPKWIATLRWVLRSQMDRYPLRLMKRATILLMALFMAVTVVCASGPDGDTIKRSFRVRPGGTLYLDIDIGNVEIESTDDDVVHVVMERYVDGVDSDVLKSILERHEWLIDQDGNDIVVESRFDRDRDDDSWSIRRLQRKFNFRLKVTIIVPEEYNIDFRTGAGNVEIGDLYGEIIGRTGAGNIWMGEVDGPVDVTSGSGNIEIESVLGYARLRLGAGNIEIEESGGAIDAQTGAGDIIVTIVRQPQEDSELMTGAGKVIVYMNDDIAVDVDAHATVGSAKCEFGLRVKGKWMSKSFEGRINGGGPDLTLRAGVGNVYLRRN